MKRKRRPNRFQEVGASFRLNTRAPAHAGQARVNCSLTMSVACYVRTRVIARALTRAFARL
jgi:hypothetical protein